MREGCARRKERRVYVYLGPYQSIVPSRAASKVLVVLCNLPVAISIEKHNRRITCGGDRKR